MLRKSARARKFLEDTACELGKDSEIAVGPDPSMWGNAQQIDAGTGDHGSYFDPSNPAMKNLGHIIIGDNENVTPKK